MEGVFGQWRAAQDEFARHSSSRSGSCTCTLYFSYSLAVFIAMLCVFNAATGLCGIFTWNVILLAGMYTLFLSFVHDFFSSGSSDAVEG